MKSTKPCAVGEAESRKIKYKLAACAAQEEKEEPCTALGSEESCGWNKRKQKNEKEEKYIIQVLCSVQEWEKLREHTEKEGIMEAAWAV